MISEYRPGYWRIFRELFEAACKAMLVAAIYTAFMLSRVFSNMKDTLKDQSESLVDTIIGSFAMVGLGYLFFLPFLLLFVFFVAAPITTLIYKRHLDSLWVLVFAGGFLSSIFMVVIPEIFSDEEFILKKFISTFNQMFCTGALTGFLFYRKMKKHIDFKTEQKTIAQNDVTPASP